MAEQRTPSVPAALANIVPGLRALIEAADDRDADMAALVSGLPEGALDWRPAADATSLAGLALHIVDVESHVAALARGEDDGWAGENGSRTSERANARELLGAIAGAGAALIAALGDLDWDSPRAAGVIADLDHVATHHGQMQLTRHLWEEAHPGVASDYEHWR